MISHVLIRQLDDRFQTLSTLYIYDSTTQVFQCRVLEPAWLWNKPNESCVPPGTYKLDRRNSETYGTHLRLTLPTGLEVPDRSLILMHSGNYRRDTKGCLLPGKTFTDINGDGFRDVTNSRTTLEKILQLTPDGSLLKIVALPDLPYVE